MVFDGFRPLDEKLLVEYLMSTPALAAKLGNQLDDLEIKEVGDGNLNFVYIVIAQSGSFVIKQALQYIRFIDDLWPMTKERAYFEASTLQEHGRPCPENVPEVYHFDRTMCLIGMRYLEPPHIILRKGLIAGIEYSLNACLNIAKTLYYTSVLYLTTTEHKSADFEDDLRATCTQSSLLFGINTRMVLVKHISQKFMIIQSSSF